MSIISRRLKLPPHATQSTTSDTVEWLATGDDEHTVPIRSMTGDDRLAARAWLRQQRHVLHRTLVGECVRAPEGWIEDRPLYRALEG